MKQLSNFSQDLQYQLWLHYRRQFRISVWDSTNISFTKFNSVDQTKFECFNKIKTELRKGTQ